MIESTHDSFKDVESIHAFVSYKEYLELPQFKSYVKEKGLVLPQRRAENTIRRDVQPLSEQSDGKRTEVARTEEKSKTAKEGAVANGVAKTNVAAVITVLLGLAFVAWLIVGYFVKAAPEWVFALYDGMNLFELFENLGKGSLTDTVASIICYTAVVIEVAFAVIGGIVRIKKSGMGMVMIACLFVAFAMMTGVAVIGMIKSTAVPMGVAVGITAITFFVSVVAGKGKNSVKENG